MSGSTSSHASTRFISIDLLKACGSIFLIVLHQSAWFLTVHDGHGLRFPEAYSLLFQFYYSSGLHVLGLQFPVLAGVTYYLALCSSERGVRWVVSRASILLVLGCSMNFLAWGSASTFTWDVLPFLALSMVLSFPLVRGGIGLVRTVLLLALITLCLKYSYSLPLSEYRESYIHSIIIGHPRGIHYWPFLPWYALFAAGILLGALIRRQKRSMLMAASSLGIFMTVMSVLTHCFFPTPSLQQLWGTTLFKPKWLFVIGVIGFVYATLPMVELFFSARLAQGLRALEERRTFFCLLINSFGRGSLVVYVGSTVLGVHASEAVLSYGVTTWQEAQWAFLLLTFGNLVGSFLLGWATLGFRRTA